MFPPKPDGQTDIQTDIRTDISIYKVASLQLIKFQIMLTGAVASKTKSPLPQEAQDLCQISFKDRYDWVSHI